MNINVLKTRFRSGELTKPEFIREALANHNTLFDYVDVVRTTDVGEIRITSDGVSFTLGEEKVVLFCPPDESRVAPIEIMNFDQYEPDETRVIDLLSAKSRYILDIGANIGWYSIRFSKRNSGVKVYAFEPMPTNYEYLQKNVSVNAVGQRVSTFNYGLSEESGAFEFFVVQKGCTNASLKNVADIEGAMRVTALAITLDQWVSSQRVSPDFIKCDVEGAELLVFRGARETLENCKPVVVTELLRKWSKPFGYHPNDVLNLFSDIGYRCFAIGSSGTRVINEVTDDTIETNYCFLHNEKHAELIRVMESVI